MADPFSRGEVRFPVDEVVAAVWHLSAALYVADMRYFPHTDMQAPGVQTRSTAFTHPSRSGLFVWDGVSLQALQKQLNHAASVAMRAFGKTAPDGMNRGG